MQRDLAEQQLSRRELQDLRNKRTGLTIFQISWILVFICLAMVNLQLRGASASWPPPGVEKLPWLLPTIATGGLLVSAFLTRRGAQMIRQGDATGLVTNWRVVLALGAAFVLAMGFEFITIPGSGTYSDVFRMMTGFHAVHALAIGAYMLWVLRGAREGHYKTLANQWPVEGAASLWYFVVIAWMIFYIVLYWV